MMGTDTASTDEHATYDGASRVRRFFVTDRSVGRIAGSASLAATQLSAGTLVGTIGVHYATGVSFLAIWPGIWLGWLFSLRFVAPQMRRFGGVTVPDYFAARYTDDGAGGGLTRALVATLIAGIYLVYTAAQYVAGGVLLQALFGVPQLWGMAGIVALTLAYTATGGMRASVVSDVVQVALIVVGLVAAVAVGVGEVGGVRALYRQSVAIDPTLFGLGMTPTRIAGFAMAFGLGMAIAPYEIGRVYAMRDEATVVAAIKGSVVIQAVVAVCVAVLGLVARVLFPDLATPDAAVVELALSMLGPVAGGLLVLGIFAAILSTVDSILLVTASAVAHDLYACTLRGRVVDPAWADQLPGSDGDVMVVTRVATVAGAVAPLLLLAVRPESLGGLVQLIVALYATLLAGTLFAPLVLGLHWERATTAGGIAGVLVGASSVVVWHLGTTVTGTIAGSLATTPTVLVGVLASTVSVVAVSLATG
jgi:SSS family transporter